MVLFAVLNVFSKDLFSGVSYKTGFPFIAYESRLYSQKDEVREFTVYSSVRKGRIVWSGLIPNCIVALSVSAVFGLAVSGLQGLVLKRYQ